MFSEPFEICFSIVLDACQTWWSFLAFAHLNSEKLSFSPKVRNTLFWICPILKIRTKFRGTASFRSKLTIYISWSPELKNSVPRSRETPPAPSCQMVVSDPAKLWLLGAGSGEERRGAVVVAASGGTRSLLHRRGGHQVNPASEATELRHPLPRGVPLKVQSVDGKAEW